MDPLTFEDQAPIPGPEPNRADIALFVGFVARRDDATVPAELARWHAAQGWSEPRAGLPAYEQLLDLPVPIASWDAFDRLFAWDSRRAGDPMAQGSTYLGAAVRSFFAEGGRTCYVVRVDDPWPLATPRSERLAKLELLVPGLTDGRAAASPRDRTTWSGVGHLFGLPDVSFVALPDLADAVGTVIEPEARPQPADPGTERFTSCVASPPAPTPHAGALLGAPQADATSFDQWSRVVRVVGRMLTEAGREAQLIAAVPRPAPSAVAGAAYPAGSDLLGFLIRRGELAGALGKFLRTRDGKVIDSPNSIASEFVQLCYPWVRTTASPDLPGGLQGPEGVLAGLLARNALARGTFRSAAGLPTLSVYDTDPPLGRSQIRRAHDELQSGTIAGLDLSDRVSLIGPNPDGYGLVSDVTTTADEPLRPAGVRRLISAVVRAARRVGEDLVFENSGENTWGRLAGRLAGLMADFYAAGALRGATADDAFEVRCGRGTMTQNDIDNGRLVAMIQLNPAASVEQLTVVLAAQDGSPLTATAMKGVA